MSTIVVTPPDHLREDSAVSTYPIRDCSGEAAIHTAIPFARGSRNFGHPGSSRHTEINPRENAYRISALLLLGDWLVACIAIVTGLLIREVQVGGSSLRSVFGVGPRPYLLLWSMGAATLFTWFMLMAKTYELENIFRLQRCFKSLLRSVFFWSLTIWAAIGLFRIEGFTPRVGAIYSMVTLTGFLITWRVGAFVALANSRLKRAASFRVLVVGWSEKTSHLRNAMQMDLAELGDIVGYVPLPNSKVAATPSDLDCLGHYDSLQAIVKDHGITSIVLAEVTSGAEEIQRLIRFCQREMIGFQMVPDYFPALNSGLQIQTVSGVPLLGVNRLPLDRMLNRALKRALDLIGALVGLAISALILPWFCALVFVESPGAVIYRQNRTSRSGRSFYIYKIRSMHLDAETKTGAVWCKREDPRRLRIGAFMRRWNIDELPQFWNVLTGDMSLVGPRPERPELIERFKNEIPNYNARHEVRAGLTGWAQIHGWRGDTDLRKRIEADLYYLENWSVMLDLYCLVATFFRSKNAH